VKPDNNRHIDGNYAAITVIWLVVATVVLFLPGRLPDRLDSPYGWVIVDVVIIVCGNLATYWLTVHSSDDHDE
jgi:hypothetical protein